MIDIDFKDGMPIITVLIENKSETEEYRLSFERKGPDRVYIELNGGLGICFREIMDTRPYDDEEDLEA